MNSYYSDNLLVIYKEPVTTSPDLAEVDVASSTDEPPVQQTTFLVGELVTGQVANTSLQDLN